MKIICVLSSLVTLYGRCEILFDAYRVLQETEDRNVNCWTTMNEICHQHGCASEVIELFEEMLIAGVEPE